MLSARSQKIIRENLKPIVLLAMAGVCCGLLILFRTLWTKSFDYIFLVWNLGLASAPFLFSTISCFQSRLPLRIVFGFLWLLFLPKAPYLITDLIHMRVLASGPIWLDVLMLTSCAATGLALAYTSTTQVHNMFQNAGKPMTGWVVSISGMFLCGFGIYLGRFLRWRSIDLFQEPLRLIWDIVERLANPFVHYRAWGVTLGFGCALSFGYVVLFFATNRESFARRRADLSDEPIAANKKPASKGGP